MRRLLAFRLLVLAAGAAHAQQFAKPVRIFVGASAGGTTDTLARAIAPEMSKALHDAAVRAIQSPELKKRLEAEGAHPVGNPPAEFARFVRDDVKKWAPVVRYSGAKPE